MRSAYQCSGFNLSSSAQASASDGWFASAISTLVADHETVGKSYGIGSVASQEFRSLRTTYPGENDRFLSAEKIGVDVTDIRLSTGDDNTKLAVRLDERFK